VWLQTRPHTAAMASTGWEEAVMWILISDACVIADVADQTARLVSQSGSGQWPAAAAAAAIAGSRHLSQRGIDLLLRPGC
jgi:hypothetical protein